ncbi:MAG: hypothetical protein H6732_03375 [Alphaproteobacteria bacterium]|nr:hypothetical protein [Alphaproteobacteria bacterium]
MRWLLPMLAACGAPPPPAPSPLPDAVTVDAAVEARGPDPELVVTVTAPAGRSWSLAEPTHDQVRFSGRDERVEQVGGRTVTRRRWAVHGPPGGHRVDGLCAVVEGSADPPPCADVLWIDIGVKPDRKEIADIVEPDPVGPGVPWAWLAAGTLLLGAGAGALAWRRRTAPEPEAVPVAEEPPHLAAIRRWEALRDDPTLSDHDKAVGLSEVFRTYVEATLGFPARAWTTTQTLAHLGGLDALPKLNVPRARRLLMATDRVKYAEVPPGESFFDQLESDLHGFVDATRPRSWDHEEGA